MRGLGDAGAACRRLPFVAAHMGWTLTLSANRPVGRFWKEVLAIPTTAVLATSTTAAQTTR